jgi:hypothetical protein
MRLSSVPAIEEGGGAEAYLAMACAMFELEEDAAVVEHILKRVEYLHQVSLLRLSLVSLSIGAAPELGGGLARASLSAGAASCSAAANACWPSPGPVATAVDERRRRLPRDMRCITV